MKSHSPVLLTLSQSTIPGGMETYSRALKEVVPDLQIRSRESLHTPPGILDSFAKEPAIARGLARELAAETDAPSLIFSNGMMGCALQVFLPDVPRITLLHGTFVGLATHAYPFWSPLRWRMQHMYAPVERQAAQEANACIANSAFTTEEARKYYGVSPHVVEPPIDDSLFFPGIKSREREARGWTDSETHILFVGNPTYSKGFDLIEALARKHPEYVFDLVCVPAPPTQQLNIRVHPPQSLEKLASFYRAADVVLFPSRYEGFGLVPLEALACGTPVVGGNVGILRSLTNANLVHVKEHTLKGFSDALKDALERTPSTSAAREIPVSFSTKSFRTGIQNVMREVQERRKHA